MTKKLIKINKITENTCLNYVNLLKYISNVTFDNFLNWRLSLHSDMKKEENMQKREICKIEGIMFASYELENNEFKEKVLKEANNLQEKPEGLVTRGYIFQRTKSGLNTRFTARLEMLEIGRTMDFAGVRYKRVSQSLFVGEDIYMIHSRYRRKKMDTCEEGT